MKPLTKTKQDEYVETNRKIADLVEEAKQTQETIKHLFLGLSNFKKEAKQNVR